MIYNPRNTSRAASVRSLSLSHQAQTECATKNTSITETLELHIFVSCFFNVNIGNYLHLLIMTAGQQSS